MKNDDKNPASPASRRAYTLARTNGQCEFRTKNCTAVATDVGIDPGWRAVGVDDAPAHALRACCEVCREKWAR